MSEIPVKWTAAGLTPAGNALQAALLGTGDGLTFTRAAAADAEGVERLDLTLQAPCTVDGPKCRVPVLLTNAGVETAFTMTELRFYVRRVTDGASTGEEVLYATVTDETGDPIPTAAQSPGFTIDWAFVFQFGNASEVTVTLDPVGLVSIGMVGQPNGVAGLGENGAVPIKQGGLGVTTPQAALAALGAGVRPNLFGNPYFVGGGTTGKFPINQKGKYHFASGNEFTIDRWWMGPNMQLDILQDHIWIRFTGDDGIFRQFLQRVNVGKGMHTFSALTYLNQLVSLTFDVPDDGYFDVSSEAFTLNGWKLRAYRDSSSNEDIICAIISPSEPSLEGARFMAAKLEQGNGQTLAYQDADGAWHLLPQPESDYPTQLAKCQSTLLHLGGEIAIRASYANSTGIWFFVPTPVTLRSLPVIIGTLAIRTVDGGTVYNDYTFNCENFSDNGVFVRAIKAGGNTLTDAVLIGDAYLSAEF